MNHISISMTAGESGVKYRHAAIVGDDYVPFNPSQWSESAIDNPRLALRAKTKEEEEGKKEDEKKPENPNWDDPEEIKKRDTPPKPYILQIGIPGAGKGLELVAKLIFTAGKIAAGWMVRMLDRIYDDGQKKAEFQKAIRDSIDAHSESMRDPKERAREQTAIDRRDHKQRTGDDTMVA